MPKKKIPLDAAPALRPDRLMGESRRRELEARARELRRAIDAYVEGVAASEAHASKAARALRALVLDLPELRAGSPGGPASLQSWVAVEQTTPRPFARGGDTPGRRMKDLFENDPSTPPQREDDTPSSRPRRDVAPKRARRSNAHPVTPPTPLVEPEPPKNAKGQPAKGKATVTSDEAIVLQPLPGLRRAAQARPVVLVGGVAVNEKLDWIEKHCGFTPEWIETETSSKGVQSLESRIIDGHVAAVVVLDGLLGHKHSEPIVAASRQTGTPLAYAATAGTGALKKAFAELEKKLS